MIYVKIFGLFSPVIISKSSIFQSSVLSRTHTLLDKSLRLLQLPTHISKLTTNGY